MSSIQPSQYSSLQAAQEASGAVFDIVSGKQVATYFGDTSTETLATKLASAYKGVAVFDRSHWSLLEMQGSERLDYLHNQTTNNIKTLSPGQGCETCIVSPTARLIDVVTVYIAPDSVLLLASPSDTPAAFQSLNRLIAFSDAQLTDVGKQYSVFSVVGPQSQHLLHTLGIALPSTSIHSHIHLEATNPPLRIASGTGLAIGGYTLLVPAEAAGSLWTAMVEGGATPCGSNVWETLRILQGRPAVGKEISDKFNPLEAGLWHTASFTKGCYIGQETIARLDTFNGVKQQLWGLKFSSPIPTGTTIYVGEQRAGIVTSITSQTVDGCYRGLGYIKTKFGGGGSDILAASTSGKTVDLPYSTRERQPTETD